jgi:Protein of unknown function (DUF995)
MRDMTYRIMLMTLMVTTGILSTAADAKNQGKLPKGAVPLSESESKAVYAGKTIEWNPALAYWREDGTVIGYYPVKGKEAIGEGTWTVKGNELCYTITWRGADKAGKPFVEDACAKFYKAGKAIWTENSKEEDQYQGDIWKGIEKKLKSGDKVSAKFNALKAKFGY